MQALDLLDNPLRWETERQNRIHQEAIEQKKKPARSESLPAGRAISDTIGAVSRVPHTPLDEALELSGEWTDKVFHIPSMRSALIPLDEAGEGSDWSKPFSLQKADMEPWLSFYKGYKESRLFLEALAGAEVDTLQPDFAVRALLELKRIDAKIIFEPPVQINAQVEYHDLEAELRAGDSARAKTLLKVANNVHEKQLAQAVIKGREMGNLLHDALMGEGHVNLIKAWEKQYQRKPTVQELHLMLTTGRATPERRPAASVTVTARREAPPPAASIERKNAASARMTEAPAARLPAQQPKLEAFTETAEPPLLFTPAEAKPAHSRKRRILTYLFHAAVCTVALLVYGWVL